MAFVTDQQVTDCVNSPQTTQDNHNSLHNSPDDVRVVSQSQGDVNYIPQSPDEATPDNLHLLGSVCNDLLTDNSPLIQPALVVPNPHQSSTLPLRRN